MYKTCIENRGKYKLVLLWLLCTAGSCHVLYSWCDEGRRQPLPGVPTPTGDTNDLVFDNLGRPNKCQNFKFGNQNILLAAFSPVIALMQSCIRILSLNFQTIKEPNDWSPGPLNVYKFGLWFLRICEYVPGTGTSYRKFIEKLEFELCIGMLLKVINEY